jgi:simple sugar transport system substrate-binding protein
VLAPFTNMPDDVKKMADDKVAEIKAGKFFVFTGPIAKQDGSVAVAAGAKLDDGAMLGMNWFVKGIDDKLPQ